MAEWQTRKLEVFVGRPVLVQVQLSAPKWYLNRYLFFVQLDLSVLLHTSLKRDLPALPCIVLRTPLLISSKYFLKPIEIR